MAKKPIKITEVVLRDAHQSLLATRMTMDEMRPILPEMDKIPYFSVECWGGATFDSCIRFLGEDPWERLRILRKELPHQKLQMLFRGQNMLGYRPYADDAVEYFVQKSVANGIDVIRSVNFRDAAGGSTIRHASFWAAFGQSNNMNSDSVCPCRQAEGICTRRLSSTTGS